MPGLREQPGFPILKARRVGLSSAARTIALAHYPSAPSQGRCFYLRCRGQLSFDQERATGFEPADISLEG